MKKAFYSPKKQPLKKYLMFSTSEVKLVERIYERVAQI